MKDALSILDGGSGTKKMAKIKPEKLKRGDVEWS